VATWKEQQNHRRTTRILEWNGQRHSATEWAEITGLRPRLILNRIDAGWDVERALTAPVRRQRNNALQEGYDGRTTASTTDRTAVATPRDFEPVQVAQERIHEVRQQLSTLRDRVSELYLEMGTLLREVARHRYWHEWGFDFVRGVCGTRTPDAEKESVLPHIRCRCL